MDRESEMPELDELSKSLATIRRAKREYRALDFKDVEGYCLAKRDDTLTIFLEMESFIQNNLDIFYNPDDRWVKRDKSRPSYGRSNEHNRVVSYRNVPGQYYIWIDQGIMFCLNEGNVVCISRMIDKSGTKWNCAFDVFKFHYFPGFDDTGMLPTEGYSRFSFMPTMEHYFPDESPVTFSDWSDLKKRVDSDYQNVIECRNLLIQAVNQIQEDEQKVLDVIKAIKESSKEA